MNGNDNEQQIEFWNGEGGRRWAEHDAQFERTIGPLTAPLLARIEPDTATRALDIGCGCGNQTLALARHLGPGAHVTGIDISAPMLAMARRRAAAHAAPVEFLLADASTHRFEPASFGLLFSRFGVMFFADPVAAFRNLHAACAPGARLVFCCWQAPALNDWLRLPLQAALRHVPAPAADGSARAGALRLRRPRARHRHPRGGRLRRRAVRGPGDASSASPRAMTLAAATDAMVQAGPVNALLSPLDDDQRARALDDIGAALAPHYRDGRMMMRSAAWLVSAERIALMKFAPLTLVLALMLAVCGGILLDGGGALFGLVLGALAGWQIALNERLRRLESALGAAPQRQRRGTGARRRRTRNATQRRDPEPRRSAAAPTPAPAGRNPKRAPRRAPAARCRHAHRQPAAARAPNAVDRGIAWLKDYATTGNVVAKVGVLVLFVGVSFLLKYAVERNALPIEVRLAGTAAAALALIVTGWRLRARRAAFGLILQGGGIGILYLTIFAAARLYQLLPLGFTFVLLLALVALSARTRGAAGCARAGDAGHHRRLPRAGAHLHRQRQPRGAVQLLRAAEPRHRRHRLVQGLARAEPHRFRVHLRHRRRLGPPLLPARVLRQHRALPGAVVPVLRRGRRAVRAPPSAAPARLRRRHAGLRPAAGVLRAAVAAGTRHRVRPRVERAGHGRGLSRWSRAGCGAAGWPSCAC